MDENKPSKPYLPFLIFAAVAFVAFFPCLALQKFYFANDLLASHSHFRAYLRDQILSGHFPLWDPYLCGGVPFFADLDAMMCNPVNYLTLLFPIPYGLSVFFFLHMIIAAAGTYLWLKGLRLSQTACVLGALTYGLSGDFWWEIIHPSIIASIAWFPWVMAAVERLTKGLELKWAFFSGLAFAMVFTCGNFQMTTCVFYAALPYFLFRLYTREEGGPFPWRKLVRVLLFMAWGGLPLVAVLGPVYELSTHSNRENENKSYGEYNGTFSMVPKSSYEFLFPALGVPEGSNLEYENQAITDSKNMDNDFLGVFGYLGVWVPFLALLAFQRKDKRFMYFLAGVAFLALLTAWGRYFPLHQLWCSILPGIKQSRAPFRFILVWVLFGTGLAAFGFQTLERRLAEKTGGLPLALAGTVFSLVIVLLTFINVANGWREMVAAFLGAAGLLLWGRTETWRPLGRALFMGAWILPLLFSGWAAYGTGPSTVYDYAANFPATSYLVENRSEGRFFFGQDLLYPITLDGKVTGHYFPPDYPMDFKVRSQAGYISLLLEDYVKLQSLPPELLFKLMAVKGLLFGREKTGLEKWTHKELPYVHLYESPGPSSYVTAVSKVTVVPGPEAALAALKQPGFDPLSETILTKPLPAAQALNGPAPKLTQRITVDEANRQEFQVTLDKDAFVTFSEVMYPGWRARLDGKKAEIFTANTLFRGLYIPAGEHRVEFEFVPAWWHPLLALLALWLLSFAGFALYLLRRKDPAALEKNPA